MNSRDDETLGSHRTQPEYLWLVGYEHLIDSLRDVDTPLERAQAAQNASLFFQAAQARSLAVLAEHAPALLEQLKLANVATVFEAIEMDGHPLEMGSADVHAAVHHIQGRVGDIVNPADAFGVQE